MAGGPNPAVAPTSQAVREPGSSDCLLALAFALAAQAGARQAIRDSIIARYSGKLLESVRPRTVVDGLRRRFLRDRRAKATNGGD